ncbi:MAG: ABC transporter ATP-binding protein [Pseudomonadota bacterium]|nr:ABC transporter ATP-binding protein [Pseudomonadota bacterium]
MNRPSRIELRDAKFEVEGKAILHGLNLDIAAPRIGIVGRNGSGKSTLARLLVGLVGPSSGEVRINGHDLAKDRRAALSEVGILFQNPEHQIIFPTVIEEIAFGLGQLGQSKAEAEGNAKDILMRFGLSHWENAYIASLSQGQKHLVCLMAIVAMAPKLLILDEPFAGLDIPTKAQLTRYLAHYEGSLVHITHDLADLEGYEQLIWIDQGNVKMTGARDDVIAAYLEAMHALGGDDDLADLSR